MTTWAKPGVKVVCVSGPRGGFTMLPVSQPNIGETYTIRAVRNSPATGELGFCLEEIWNPISPQWGIEYAFVAVRFRPLVTETQEQDIALFTHHLEGVGEDA